MLLDRKYSAAEVGEIAARATTAICDVPQTVQLAAHVSAAAAMMANVTTIGRLSPEFQHAARALTAIAALFLLVCETGPVSAGSKH
jgi:hypothetical protein